MENWRMLALIRKQGMISLDKSWAWGVEDFWLKGITVDNGEILKVLSVKTNIDNSDDDPARVPVLTRDFKILCILTNDDQ